MHDPIGDASHTKYFAKKVGRADRSWGRPTQTRGAELTMHGRAARTIPTHHTYDTVRRSIERSTIMYLPTYVRTKSLRRDFSAPEFACVISSNGYRTSKVYIFYGK